MNNNLLLNAFIDFYEILAELKTKLKPSNTSADYEAEDIDTVDSQVNIPTLNNVMEQPDTGVEEIPDQQVQLHLTEIHNNLKMVLLDQRKRMALTATAAEIVAHEQAIYVMAALADDILLFSDNWYGAEKWGHYLLESALFESAIAGRRIFERIDIILEQDLADDTSKDLCAVYLLALRLGFQGQYRNELEKISAYRKKLGIMIGFDNADISSALVPSTYKGLVNPPVLLKHAPLSRWYRLSMLALAGYLLVSTLVWYYLTLPLNFWGY